MGEGDSVIDTTSCPECGEVAEVQDRDVLGSTEGPVEHIKILCVNRHWFLLPAPPPASIGADLERTRRPRVRPV